MQVAASFLSSKNIPYDLERLNMTSVDYIHVDVMDGKFVKNKTLPFRQMRKISNFTSKRLDVHLMVEKPSKYIKKYASLNTAFITIHHKTKEDTKKLLHLIHSYGIKAGIAINPDTPINEVLPYLLDIDLILLMSVMPGEAGQDFIVNTPQRIEQVKKILEKENKKVLISVDGGINDQTVFYVKDADIVVSGTYLLQNVNIDESIETLKGTTK